MRVLVACEYSGVVRDAFNAAGHEAVSCDLLPTEAPGPHLLGDVRQYLRLGWDLMIAHPPCTYLCLSGVRWLHSEPGRWEKLYEAAAFFTDLLEAPIPLIAVENPRMHGYGLRLVGCRQDDTVQPWQFGDGATKATCLWLRGLPPLLSTDIVEDRAANVHHVPPGPERAKIRSRTYPGIAAAMAAQWGTLPRPRAKPNVTEASDDRSSVRASSAECTCTPWVPDNRRPPYVFPPVMSTSRTMEGYGYPPPPEGYPDGLDERGRPCGIDPTHLEHCGISATPEPGRSQPRGSVRALSVSVDDPTA